MINKKNNFLLKKYYILLIYIILFLFFIYIKNSFINYYNNYINNYYYHNLPLKQTYNILKYLHPNPIKINNNFSQQVYNKYFEILDPQKIIFTKIDINNFLYYKYNLDNAFIQGNITFFNKTIDFFYKKMKYSEILYNKILNKPFNLNLNEHINHKYNYYTNNTKEWKNRVRLYLKYLTISEMYFLLKKNKNINFKKNNYIKYLEIIARKKVQKNIQTFFKKFKTIKKKYWIYHYINSNLCQYDPYTRIFSMKEKKIFDENLSGQIEGIGIEIKDINNYITITKILVGGPAWKSNKINLGDKIINIQDYNKKKKFKGIVIEDYINYIKGKKGTSLILTILKNSGKIIKVKLIRDIVEEENLFIKSSLIIDHHNYKYGLIKIPEFYFNPNNINGRNVSYDIKQEIKILKKEKILGIILDLRNNGGGSLDTVINIISFFISKGPILQIKNFSKKIEIIKSNNNIIWNGPLTIIINKLSASASEILTAAIKDYNRGIIIGSYKTFGKGTIQSFYPLKEKKKNFGVLKFTNGKLYRINGDSTQLKGVKSDIFIPSYSFYKEENIDELNEYHHLNWDKIDPINYKKWKYIKNINYIINKSKNRINNNINLKKIYYINKKLLKIINQPFINLNWIKFIQNKQNIESEKIKIIFIKNKINNKLNFNFLKNNIYKKYNNKLFNHNITKWYKSLKTDFCIKESINILQDLQ